MSSYELVHIPGFCVHLWHQRMPGNSFGQY